MYNNSMLVLGAIFLVVLAGIFYVGTKQVKLDTAPAPVLEQPMPPVESGDTVSEDDVDEPVVMPQGKIDVRVACESALMYTTFTDGASADAYVTDCIDGKHPEVIERFISEMGVDGATI
jgi:hypothetical protein